MKSASTETSYQQNQLPLLHIHGLRKNSLFQLWKPMEQSQTLRRTLLFPVFDILIRKDALTLVQPFPMYLPTMMWRQALLMYLSSTSPLMQMNMSGTLMTEVIPAPLRTLHIPTPVREPIM